MRPYNSRATPNCMNKLHNEVICIAVQWVAFSCQPHNIEELSGALNATFTLSLDYREQKDGQQRCWSCEEILQLFADILYVTASGVVMFRDDDMRNFVHSQDFRPQTQSLPYSGHEMLAMTCLRYLQTHDPQTILRPLSGENRRSGNIEHTGHVYNYAATFWHVHTGFIERNSRYVSAMVHKTILQALSDSRLGDIFYAPKSRDKTNIGLLVCAKYDFKNLGKTYLEMGAEPNHQTSWHDSSLTAAITNSSQGMIELFLDWGADLDVLDEGRSTRFQLARSKSNTQIEGISTTQSTLSNTQSRCCAILDCCYHCQHGSQVFSPAHIEHSQARIVFPSSKLKLDQDGSHFKLLQPPMPSLANAKIRYTNSGQQKVGCCNLPLRMANTAVQASRSLISSRSSTAPSGGGSRHRGTTKTISTLGSPSRSRPACRSRPRLEDPMQADYAEEDDWLVVDKEILAVQS